MNTYKSSESEEQIGLFQWASYNEHTYPELRLMFHIPNGRYRTKTTAAWLKREGVKSGVPDICLPVARGGYHGLYIELKANKNRTTDNQDQWIADLTAEGYFATTCCGWEAAVKIIKSYLGGIANG